MKKFSFFLILFSAAFLSVVTFAQTNFWEKISPINGILAINASGTIFLGTNHGVFRSTDNGTSWSNADSNFIAYRFAFNSTGEIIYAVGSDDVYGSVFRSTDDGTSWTKIYDQELIKTIAINDSGHIFIGWGHETGGGIERSTDNGASWINTGLEANSYAIAINAGGIIFSGGWYSSGGCVFRSTDNGVSWINTAIGLSYYNVVNNLEINPAGHIFAVTPEKGIYRSTDNGEHWIQCNTSMFITCLDINSSGHIFAGTSDEGVYRSTDGGANWATVNAGLTNDTVISIAINPSGTIFAATLGGLYRSMQSTTSVKDLSADELISFSLNQNYPNPFNPSTKINYQIPTAGMVSLKVYDVLGKEITTLINEEKSAGNYEVEFSASGLSSGIYFYKLQTGGFIETKKMSLLK